MVDLFTWCTREDTYVVKIYKGMLILEREQYNDSDTLKVVLDIFQNECYTSEFS